MAEYKLSFTASEIDEKLKKVDSITSGISSWNELTDKPFYDEQNRVEILAETTSTSEYTGLFGGYAIFLPADSYELVLGNTYKILWDGEEFTCEAKDGSAILWEAVYVGDATSLGLPGGNNEPFAIVHCKRDEYDGIIVCMTDTEETAHTVAIYQDTTVIKHLDNKYLDFLELNEGVELLSEQTVTLDNEDNEVFLRLFDTTTTQFATMSAGKVGEVYTVVWQGTEYTCKMSTFDSLVVLGNISIEDATATDTGEPFLLILSPTEGLIIACKYDSVHDILAETRFAASYISDYGAYGYGFNFSDERPAFPLELGDKCIVVWDGNEYEVTVGDSSAIMPDTLYVGNGSGLGLSGNGEPFAIAWDATGETGVTIFSTVDTEHTVHTIRICQSALDANIHVYQNGECKIKPEYLPDTASGGSAEIPIFDLAAMGMEAVDINSNSSAMIETDTTEIYAALDKGAVTFSLSVTMNGETVTAICTAHSLKSMEYEQHQCVASLWLGNDLSYAAINVTKSGYIQVAALPMAQMVKEFVDAANKTATTVDLSAYESNGTIVETYSDGSTITYTMNFDDEGNPTKITDSDGNITNLTW